MLSILSLTSLTGFTTNTFRQLREDSDLVLSSIIMPGNKTHEGVLIEAIDIIWKDLLRLFKADPQIIYTIDPHKWEEIVAASYKAAGFDQVTLTPRGCYEL